MLVKAQPQNHRAALTGAYNHAWLLRAEYRDGKGPLQAFNHQAYRAEQVAPLRH